MYVSVCGLCVIVCELKPRQHVRDGQQSSCVASCYDK